MIAAHALAGKHVVVTGAGGSIASELCRQIVAAGEYAHLTMIGLTESALYNLARKLGRVGRARYVLGSVNDRALMDDVLWKSNADVVIHAAAHKHVPICESNPCEAIRNNVGGTYTLALAAAAAGVEQFLLVSTDKAVRPASVMGATKRVAERIIRDFGTTRTRFLTVRFGNVLDSAGSVLPLWREQIATGGPVTITHPDCTRYFMSIPDAVQLILGTLALDVDGGTYIFDMGEPKRIVEIARELIGARDIPIRFTGLRQGEKLEEELHHGGELIPTAHPRIFRVHDAGVPALACGDVPGLLALAQSGDRRRAQGRLMELAA